MRKKLVSLASRIKRERMDIVPSDITSLVAARRIFVGGKPITNAHALVDAHAALVITDDGPLRGTRKLRAALERWTPLIDVAGTVALDLGACTGGFTIALLERGARKVYAVDAGHGQLLGSLRLDARVVNLERTNLGALTRELVPDVVDVVVADLSYVSLATAFAELEERVTGEYGAKATRVAFAGDAVVVALVKPMFELGLAKAPLVDDPGAPAILGRAIEAAGAGLASCGWSVVDAMRSPEAGAGGAVEGFVLARRLARRNRAG